MVIDVARQSRSSNIMVNIEPIIHSLVLDVIDKEGLSASGYARRLIIEDLRRKGLLTDGILADLAAKAIR